MKHDAALPREIDGFKKLAFSPRMKRLMDKVKATPRIHSATIMEAKAVMAVARESLPGLMPDAILERLLSHNPDIVQIVTGDGIPPEKTVFNGAMPLTEAGARAIVTGHFNGADPDLAHIARAGEVPAAIYAALIFTPAAFGPAMKALTYWVGSVAPEGCPMFSRAVTSHTQHLFPALGFMPASDVYPGAPADLLVVLPEAEVSPRRIDEKRLPDLPAARPAALPEKPAKAIAVRVVRTIEDMMKVFTIRAATYMSEQLCPYEEEFDGNDFCAMHLVGEIDGEPAGCLRMRFFGDFVKIERLAVRAEFRSTKLAFRLVREGVEIARRKGFRRLYGHSRLDLARFWSVFGFREIAGCARFSFSGVDYVEMEAEIAPHEVPVAIGNDPFLLIRPEGSWDRPGPLDRSRERPPVHDLPLQIRALGAARPR